MTAPFSRPERSVTVIGDRFDGAGPTDTGVSHAIVLSVGRGEMGETFRIFPTRDVVAFGRQDVIAPGYRAAVEASRALGFEAVERLAGGRAAVFTTGTLAFSWAIPAIEPRAGVHLRFQALADLITVALVNLGVDARVGEIPGEYCPGAYSVSLAGSRKVMGVGQRLVRGAAHLGGVVAVRGTGRLRDVLVPVYRALDLGWDPGTAGSLEDAVPGITLDEVRSAILAEVGRRFFVEEGRIPLPVIEEGRRLASAHVPAVI